MTTNNTDENSLRQLSDGPTTFGFLTVVEVPVLGHCGGLLVVSKIGRPIEFHCTAPVASNRAEEIMYGKTYQGFLYSDQIGMALVDKAKHQPTIFVTDCPDMLPIAELIDQPLIFPESKESENGAFDPRGLKKIEVSNQTIYCINAKLELLPSLQSETKRFVSTLPLEEPFERIRQAIDEAHAVVRAA
ncbi:MAG: hypothetical protein AB8B55_16905 [Mariniblastus sp.]